MQLRYQFKKGMVLYKGAWVPIAYSRGQLLLRIERILDPQNAHGAYHLARQIDSSNISDIEKIDKMRMILDSERFFQLKKKNNYKNSASIDEWLAFIHTKYPEDVDFKYQLVKAGVSLAGSDLVVTNLDNLHLSKEQKIEIYRMMARQSADSFIKLLPHLVSGHFTHAFLEDQYLELKDRYFPELSHIGLNSSELKQLYLYALQFEASVTVIRDLPRTIVNDAFIQEVVKILNEHHFPTRHHLLTLSREQNLQQRELVIKQLIKAAAFYGLNYKDIYIEDTNERNDLTPFSLIPAVNINRSITNISESN